METTITLTLTLEDCMNLDYALSLARQTTGLDKIQVTITKIEDMLEKERVYTRYENEIVPRGTTK